MDLFDLQATITLDTNDYERSIGEAMRSAAQFGAGIAEAGGNVQEFAEGVLSGLSDGLREAADAGADISALDDAIASAAEGFANGTESAEEFLGKLGQIGAQAGGAVDPVSELGDEAMNAGDAQDSAGDATAFFGDMIKANLTGDIIKKAISMIKDLVVESANYGDTIDKQSQKLGISARAYQQWEAVLQHSGSSMSSMSFTFKTLANAAQDATDDQVAAFERLGMSMDEVKNMSTEDIFANVIAGLQGMEEGTERTAIATDLLGRGAMELGPLLNTSAEETQAMIDRVDALGGVMSNDGVKAAAAFSDAWQDFTTILEGKTRNAAATVLPILTDIIEYANESAEFVATIGRVDTNEYDTASEKLIALKDNIRGVHDEAFDLATSGAYDEMATANQAVENSVQQLQEAMSDPELMRQFFDEVGQGMVSTADYADIMGVSLAEASHDMREYAIEAAAASNAAVPAAEEAADAFDEEAAAAAEAAQEAHDALIDIASSAIDARVSGGDLRKEYEKLEREFEKVKDDGDATAVMLAQQKLQALNLAATNQELSKGYPALVSRLQGFGYTLTQTSAWLDANGMSAEEWGSAVNSATDNVINGFQELDTSLDMSLDEMAANMRSNIEAYSSWNENIATLMDAAKASGSDAAVAFVQYMQDMGIGAADQVAAMADDIDGTFATFAPMMGEAIDEGMTSVYNAIEGADSDTAMQGNMDDVLAVVEGTDLSPGGAGLDTSLASGIAGNSYAVSGATISMMASAYTSANDSTSSFYWVGNAIDSEIASGVSAGTYKITSAAQRAAREAYNAALRYLNSTNNVTKPNSNTPQTKSVESMYHGNSAVTNYITVNGAENPEEYANRLARQIQMQMRMV